MAKPKDDLTFEEVYKILTYDCFEGELRWSENLLDLTHMHIAAASRFRGKPAGSFDKDGYIAIHVKGATYKAHRLAWLMTYEEWPSKDIDHVDGNPSNNRIENLREATKSENLRNQRLHKNSTTGVTGVVFHKKNKRYGAYIKSNGKDVYLGWFSTLEEAAAARQAANEEYGYHPLHGTVKNG